MSEQIRVRMAPSPTGHLHVGTARAALFNYLYARHYGATFILRLEDTDQERSRDEFAREIVEGLEWMGMRWDEGPYVEGGEWRSRGDFGPYLQSQRTETYRTYLERLLASGHAYWCYCTKEELEAERARQQEAKQAPRYAGTCRELSGAPEGKVAQVVRFKTPGGDVTFADVIRGEIKTDAALLDDFAIAKGLDAPLYNFAVVADDIEMQITHVIRGEDHISNTPKQLLIFAALGATPPRYAHLPLVLAADRTKLSKRTSETSLLAYRDQGFLPSALVNFFALLGWHPAGDREVLSPDELIAEFTIERVQKSGAVFDEAKLRHINREHIKLMDPRDLALALRPFFAGANLSDEVLERFAAAEQGRADTLAEMAAGAAWLTSYELPGADVLDRQGGARAHLEAAAAAAASGRLESWIAPYAEEHGKKEVYWPVRVALSGSEKSPDPVSLAAVLGPEESAARLAAAAQKLQ